MKKIIFILLTILSANTYGQKISVTEIKEKYLKSILCAVDTVIFKRNDVISVILYEVSNPAGSAHLSETDESSNRFLIAVTTGDEVPEQHLFSVGNFLNPKIRKFEKLKDNNYSLVIEYGIFKVRKTAALKISLNNVLLESK
ncbi:MAG TPA: hypothetical protein VNW95_15270 [Mucilaginibacter sp.]|jgi:hypothetical protein|nr:hypothetical protein [Mucilaginibacter sp.]